MKKIKIAVLGSYTVNNIEKELIKKLEEDGFEAEVRFGGFNQFNQELRDQTSWLHIFKPDILLVALTTKTFFPNLQNDICEQNFASVKEGYVEQIQLLLDAIEHCELSTKILLTTLDRPLYSPYGSADVSREDGVAALIQECNQRIITHAQKTSSLLVIDFDMLCSVIGKQHMTDQKMHYLGKIELNKEMSSLFVSEIQTQVRQIFGKIKKCMIVDLDNTLWGGVIGEDGAESVEIGDSTIGAIYTDIQKYLLNLKRTGTLLAIVSKNNKEDVLPIFKRAEMILKEEDFITSRINWEPKSVNIESIAKELNLGLDSFVFLDDNPVERLEVHSRLPEVEIIEVPTDIAKLPALLERCNLFWKSSITEEDKKRHDMYVQERKRTQVKTAGSLQDYLKELRTTIRIQQDDVHHLERITQLINKTNQFNVRTQRYTSDEVRTMMESKKNTIFSIHVTDKFGELGLTGVLIFEQKEQGEYFIDTFLLSCRILSRDIEKKFFSEAVKILGSFTKIHAEFISSQKNTPSENIFEKLGFTKIKAGKNKTTYELDKQGYKALDVDTVEVIFDATTNER